MALTVNRPTSLGLSVALHASFLLAGVLATLFAAHGEELMITPVTLIGPDAPYDPGYFEKADVIEEAMTETPLDILPPAPVAEVAAPTPAPKSPPAPKPAPSPRAPAATKAAPAAARAPAPSFDLSALDAELAAASRNAGVQRAGGRQGPSQAQRALDELLSQGQARAATADALKAIGGKIMRNWRINCADAETRNVRVTLRLELDRRGGLVRSEVVGFRDVESIRDPVVKSAATLALSAARAASPFDGLPEQTFNDWRLKTYEFQGDVACEGR